MQQDAFAKINLTLEVLNRRADGYHNIRTIFTSISLKDVITVSDSDNLKISCNNPLVPLGQQNICHKAAILLKEKFKIEKGVMIDIKKTIPISAGLAGGSTDAAAALVLLSRLWNIKIDEEELLTLASTIGADVPYCIKGGTWLATGIGEVLEESYELPHLNLVIINPGINISTKEAYELHNIDVDKEKSKGMIKAIEAKDLKGIATSMHNDFEKTIFEKYPEVREIKKNLLKNGALNALLCGSGSSVLGVFEDEKGASAAADSLKHSYPFVRKTESI